MYQQPQMSWLLIAVRGKDVTIHADRYAGGDVAMRNFPSAENSSISQFSKQRSGGFHHFQLLFCLLLFIFLFFNLPPPCQSLTVSCSLRHDSEIKLLLIGGADDHTVSPALLSVFNSYLAHSTPLSSSLHIWVDLCRFISKPNCFARD